jgi:hypothetical protein
MKIKYLLSVVIIMMLLLNISYMKGQYGSFGTTDAQSIGMGNIFGAAFGTLAIGKNPAFLAYPKDSTSYIQIQFPNLELKALETSMSIADFNNYFNYPEAKDLTDKERDEFYGSFGEDNGFYFNLGSKVFAIAVKPSREIGTFAISMTDYFAGSLKIPLTLIDLAINGNAPLKNYSFNDMKLNTWWIRTTSLSYARDIMKFEDEKFIKNLTGGISLKMVSGYLYAGIEEFEANLETGENNVLDGNLHYLARSAFSPDLGVEYDFEDDDNDNSGSAGYFNEPAGMGFGFDIGFAADLAHNLRVGLALTDIGSITWDNHTAEYKADGNIHIEELFNEEEREELEDFLEDSSYSISGFSTSLPTALRLSIAYDISKAIETIPGDLTLLMGYNQGFNDMPGNSTEPRIALGAKWKTQNYIPVIYTGFTNDRSGKLDWTFGLGWSTNVIDIAFATQDLITLIGGTGSPLFSFAMNMVWRIGL